MPTYERGYERSQDYARGRLLRGGSPFRLTRQENDGESILLLTDELDIASAPALERALFSVSAVGRKALLVDLRGLTFMDVSGLRVILGAERRCAENHVDFALVRGSSNIHRLFEITGVSERLRFEERETVPDHLQAIGLCPSAC